MNTIRFRVASRLVSQIDKIARARRRHRNTVIREALTNYVDVQMAEVAKIRKALCEADRGEFASDDEVRKTIQKWVKRSHKRGVE